MRVLTLASAALALGACASTSPPDAPVMCTMEARSSFSVTVVDSISGRAVTSGATVRVTEGAFSDTLVAPFPGDSAYGGGVYERSGDYTVLVTHRDYQPWQRTSVRVTKDECHVTTQQLTAKLRPIAD